MRIKYKTRVLINRIIVALILVAMILSESQIGNLQIRTYASENDTNVVEDSLTETTENADTTTESIEEMDNTAVEQQEATTAYEEVLTEATTETVEEQMITTGATTETTTEATTVGESAPNISNTTSLTPQLNGNTTTTEENVTSAEDMIISGNTTLTSDLTVGNLEVGKNQILDLNGYILTVEGNSTIKGKVSFGKGELICYGDINISSDATITMDNANDYMIAYGNLTYYGESELSAGVIESKGDFTANNNFIATGSHKVIFSGDEEQKISVSDEGKFNEVEIRNFTSAGITILYSFNYASLTDNNCVINYADIGGERGCTLEEDTEVNGTYYLVSDVLDLNGYTLIINGDLIQAGGTININGGHLIVNGNYKVQSRTVDVDKNVSYGKSAGTLVMTNSEDSVYIDGDFISETSANHTGKLTDGVMEITGDVSVSDEYSIYAFVASGNHTVILSGENPQNICVSIEKTTNYCRNTGNHRFENSKRECTVRPVVIAKEILVAADVHIKRDCKNAFLREIRPNKVFSLAVILASFF